MTIPIIGIDAEWQTSPDGQSVSVLSYQWFGLDEDREWSGIHYPDLTQDEKRKRLKINQWVSLALQQGYQRRRWPRRIVVASHYTTAELSVIRDFGRIKHRVDLVQGTSFTSARQPFKRTCYDKSRNPHDVTIHLLDSMLLAPDDGKSLAALGSLLGCEKLDLPEGYSKSDMLQFLNEKPDLFKQYAIRDAEITARYIRRVEQQCRDLGLDNYRPVTIGGLAQRTFLQRLEQGGRTYDNIMDARRDRVRQGGYTNRNRVYRNGLADRHEQLAIDSYHGGRNECFLFGFHKGVFADYDLEGAYSTALAAFVEPDYENLKETTNPNDYRLDQIGFALVRWKFPKSTRFPCLFQRDPNGHGLIYVLEGEGYLTSPEIALALRMGADITIRSGVVIPSVSNGVRPFLGFSQWVNQQRKQHPKKTDPFENAFFKLIGNNVYGKVAQGLKNSSRVFDSRLGSTVRLERSRVSDAYAAAYTTGLVRATTSEILSRLPDNVLVGNSITDGVCSTATEEQMKAATTGPQCQFFSDLRMMICDDPHIIDVKGRVNGMVFMRTRMHATTGKVLEGDAPILAKVNVPMRHLKDEENDEAISKQKQNDILIKEFVEREWDKEWKSRSLTSAKELWEKEGDLLNDEFVKFLGMDYDLKRKPYKPTTHNDHLAFQTNPWLNHEEYAKCRKVFDQFKEPLKSELDLDVFFQEVDTLGTAKNRTRGKRRKILFARDLSDRMAVGDDGLVNEDGERLKPRVIDSFLRELTGDEVGASGDQLRKTRSRIKSGDKALTDNLIEVTTSVSVADETVRSRFPAYTGKALKRKSSVHVKPKT